MSVYAWLLIQTEIGRARSVADAVAAITYPGVRVLQSDTVTGPHDVIAHFEASDVDILGDVTASILAAIGGVQKVVTSIKLD